MLYSIDDRQPRKEAHEVDFQARRSAIADADYQAMVEAIDAFCDRTDSFCASWLPGQDAAISAAFPPLTAACGDSKEESGENWGHTYTFHSLPTHTSACGTRRVSTSAKVPSF